MNHPLYHKQCNDARISHLISIANDKGDGVILASLHLLARQVIHTIMRWLKRLTDFTNGGAIEYLKQQWQGVNDVELATLEWVDWFNKTRIHNTD